MAKTAPPRHTHEKVTLFRQCFTGLLNVYGTYNPRNGRVRQVKKHVSDAVILAHLRGRQPYGVYLLTDDTTRAIVADFDDGDPTPARGFVQQAGHYGIAAYLERSKRKGWHAWIFMQLPGASAMKARLVVKMILEEIDRPATEIFPKQDRLVDDTRFGNFINAPLYGALVPRGRTVFVDPANPTKPLPDQWGLLKAVRRVPERLLDEIIEINGLAVPKSPPASPSPSSSDHRRSFGLPPCAQTMLADGVTANQRVACFRLAVNLKQAGLPFDSAVAVLRDWAKRNRPTGGNRTIVEDEIIAQAACAYGKDYRACGCEDPAVRPYCRAGCWVK
ncbi:MAG: hypothetical protein J5J06_15700 [Phycisphaerae bacterium]|nr:hypothetical protein [Phycisphaerae bacterium]